ncbi:MAG TPA: YicC family protein, partial [Bacteroidetes bacterium]|nr:YicC family protein [Bacteroidota bacterium]HEX03692.1 YicC family protein [Bacteroidota bacterium]
EEDGQRYSVEVRSVNNRFLDISTRLPRTLLSLDADIRAMVKGKIERGKVNVLVEEPREDVQRSRLEIDMSAAKALVETLREVARQNEIEGDISLGDIANNLNLLSGSEDSGTAELRQGLILRGLKDAISNFNEMAASEGANLEADFQKRLSLLEGLSAEIKTRSAENRELSLQRIRERIEKYISHDKVDDNRLEQEVAYLVDRIDITEELVRLASHIDLFRKALKKGGLVGKRLNFILQEMNREVNTIGSKTIDGEIASWVVEAKEELEKLREQVQNVA